jgi:cytochrome P450
MSAPASPSPPSSAGQCPVLPGFNPLDPNASDDELLAGWARARAEVPVFYVPEKGWWCVSTLELQEDVMRRPGDFSSRIKGAMVPVPAEAQADLPDGWPMNPNIASTDPPEHTRIRKLAQRAFTPRAAAAHTDDIRAIANHLIDGFIDRGTVDLGTEYTRMITINVIAPIWGVPQEDVFSLYGWAHQAMAMVDNPDIDDAMIVELGRAMAAFKQYADALVAERRHNPRGEDDLLTALITATGDEGEPALTDKELMSLVISSIAAGTETTATTMAHVIHTLLSRRERWEEVLAEPDLIPNIAEETLRLWPPVRSINRITTRECDVGGVTIPADAMVHLPFLSAGRDEAAFADADRFDPRRANAKHHITFGKWTHFCLGAPLARLELKIGVETLTQRIPGIRLADDCRLNHFASVGIPVLIDGLKTEWDAP